MSKPVAPTLNCNGEGVKKGQKLHLANDRFVAIHASWPTDANRPSSDTRGSAAPAASLRTYPPYTARGTARDRILRYGLSKTREFLKGSPLGVLPFTSAVKRLPSFDVTALII